MLLYRPDGKKTAYVRLTLLDRDALDVADKVRGRESGCMMSPLT